MPLPRSKDAVPGGVTLPTSLWLSNTPSDPAAACAGRRLAPHARETAMTTAASKNRFHEISSERTRQLDLLANLIRSFRVLLTVLRKCPVDRLSRCSLVSLRGLVSAS